MWKLRLRNARGIGELGSLYQRNAIIAVLFMLQPVSMELEVAGDSSHLAPLRARLQHQPHGQIEASAQGANKDAR